MRPEGDIGECNWNIIHESKEQLKPAGMFYYRGGLYSNKTGCPQLSWPSAHVNVVTDI